MILIYWITISTIFAFDFMESAMSQAIEFKVCLVFSLGFWKEVGGGGGGQSPPLSKVGEYLSPSPHAPPVDVYVSK